MKVYALARPFTLTFSATGQRYPLTSEEVQRLLDSYAIVRATRNRVTLRGDDGRTAQVTAATLGGGPAFEIEKGGR